MYHDAAGVVATLAPYLDLIVIAVRFVLHWIQPAPSAPKTRRLALDLRATLRMKPTDPNGCEPRP
jgi:hypothetical protein